MHGVFSFSVLIHACMLVGDIIVVIVGLVQSRS